MWNDEEGSLPNDYRLQRVHDFQPRSNRRNVLNAALAVNRSPLRRRRTRSETDRSDFVKKLKGIKKRVRREPRGLREKLNQKTEAGRKEYRRRTIEMAERQNWLCAHPECGKLMTTYDLTFDHTDGRGMGGARRDDRIVDENGKPMNSAMHLECNLRKGSKRL
jgi:hypothetical protein